MLNFSKDRLTELGINIKEYGDDGILVLNYTQYNSPKFNPDVDKCRGLIVKKDSFSIISRSFDRFYNFGEDGNVIKEPLEDFYVMEKVDGSLIKVYYYNNKWNISTRGTAFGENFINKSLSDVTYEKAIRPFIDNMERNFDTSLTYIFEYCSPLNRVVIDYGGKSRLFYLMSRNNQTGEYVNQRRLFKQESLPKIYKFSSFWECIERSREMEGLDEGFVLYYRKTNTPFMKIKNPRYVAYHHRRTNGGLNLNNIISLYTSNDIFEYLHYFPNDKKFIEEFLYKVENHFKSLQILHERNKNLERKVYAKLCPSFLGFKALDKGLSIKDAFLNLSKERREKYLKDLFKFNLF